MARGNWVGGGSKRAEYHCNTYNNFSKLVYNQKVDVIVIILRLYNDGIFCFFLESNGGFVNGI